MVEIRVVLRSEVAIIKKQIFRLQTAVLIGKEKGYAENKSRRGWWSFKFTVLDSH